MFFFQGSWGTLSSGDSGEEAIRRERERDGKGVFVIRRIEIGVVNRIKKRKKIGVVNGIMN